MSTQAEEAARQRATQSMLGTVHFCLKHPTLLAVELLWRWLFGIPMLWVLLQQGLDLWKLVPPGTLERLEAVEYDPVQASTLLVALSDSLLPAVLHLLAWMLPVFLLGWAVVSGLGRWAVLRRLATLRSDLLPLPPAPVQALQLIAFQMLRIAGLTAAIGACIFCIHHGANAAFADSQNPNLVLYFTVVIVSVLGAFTVWALLSWSVTLAPMLLVKLRCGFAAAIRQGTSPGRTLVSNLMEINLVLGIVKLAQLVLAMVFSAIPIPFEEATTPQELHIWWAIVTVAYLIVNAFFQVVRLVATLQSVESQG